VGPSRSAAAEEGVCERTQAREQRGVRGEYHGASSPESSSKGTPGQEKFVAMRIRTPAKRLLVFDGENTCHDTWDSASSGTSDDETVKPRSGSAEANLYKGEEQARTLLASARALALSDLQGVGGKANVGHATQEKGDGGRREDSDDDDQTFMGDDSSDLSAIMRVASSDEAAEQARVRRKTAKNALEVEPELHDVTDRLWDFAQHIDRIEKHTVALRCGSLFQDQVVDRILLSDAVMQEEDSRGATVCSQRKTKQEFAKGKSACSPMRSSLDSSRDLLSQDDLRGSVDYTSANVEKTAAGEHFARSSILQNTASVLLWFDMPSFSVDIVFFPHPDVKRLCSDFKKNERGEEEIRQVGSRGPLSFVHAHVIDVQAAHENGVYVQIMAKAELHLSMLENELLSRIDLDGSQKQSRKGGMRKSNARSPSKKTEISTRDVATRNETPTPTGLSQTLARHQSRAWEKQAQVIPLHFRVLYRLRSFVRV